MRSAAGAPSPLSFAVAHTSWGRSTPVGEGVRDGCTHYEDRALCLRR